MSDERITPLAEQAKEETPTETPIEGVLARTRSDNIKPHRFLPGQSGNPGGRTKRPDTQVLALIAAQVPAQMIVDGMIELLDNSSWRAREAGIKLYLSYMIGMPVQRSVTASTKLESILDRVRDMDEGEFTQVIDAMKSE